MGFGKKNKPSDLATITFYFKVRKSLRVQLPHFTSKETTTNTCKETWKRSHC